MDLRMPVLDGVQATQLIKQQWPAVTVVVLTVTLAACSSSGKSASPENTATTVPAVTTTTIPRCTVKSRPALERIDLNVGGKARYALVHVPAHWNGKTALPVLLSFHGLGSNADQQRSIDGFAARSDKDNFVVMWPQASGSLADLGAAWDLKGASELAYVQALLANLARRECINPARVYATGLSYGGAMTGIVGVNRDPFGIDVLRELSYYDGSTGWYAGASMTGSAIAGAFLGLMLVLPIGGADMPVVISLLNSFTGTAAAMAGFVIGNPVLIIAGALVGASGGRDLTPPTPWR